MSTQRTTTLTDVLADAICDRLIQGESLRSICRDEKMPGMSTVMRWLGRGEDGEEPFAGFLKAYTVARQLQAELYYDEMIEIADDSSKDVISTEKGKIINKEFVERSKLRVHARQWTLARMLPKKYGDRLQQEISGKDGTPIVSGISIYIPDNGRDKPE